MTGAVRELTAADRRAAARVLSDAFLDEPLWRVVGPRRRWQRRRVLLRLHAAEIRKARRWGGPSLAIYSGGGLDGILIAWEAPRDWPPPQPWSTLIDLPSLLLAGPLPAIRAGPVDWQVQRLRSRAPHVYLYLLGVDPRHQRSGIGARLVEAVVAHAFERGLPVMLETMAPQNPAFYAKQGFEIACEVELIGGQHAWLMRRDP